MYKLDKVYVYTDGASRGNPGRSASGFAIYNSTDEIIKDAAIYNGIKTNNYAEYNAIILALTWCKNNLDNSTEIILTSDSELVIKQINGVYKIKSLILKQLNEEVLALAKFFKSIKFRNDLRTNPKIAYVDKKLNFLLDSIEKKEKKDRYYNE
ncbi:MAG: ribonuclease HI family protein [Candidatus Micrarchaeia archaeon]